MPAAIEKEMELAVRKAAPASLPQASLFGALYLLVGLGLLQYGLPMAWERFVAPGLGGLVSGVGLVAVLGVVLAALVWAYPRVVPQTEGSKAGVAAAVLFILLGFVLIYLGCLTLDAVFGILHRRGILSDEFNAARWMAGAPIAAFLALLWVRWGWRLLAEEKNQRRIRAVEEQGWFETGAYKPNQGKLIRRLTMLGVLAMVAGGFVHFYPAIQRGMTGNWAWPMPFADQHQLVLAHMPGLTVSAIIALGALWLTYRAVNAPKLADFLIATSAEMQKVSWSTRKQIVRDTIVVLVVTALLSAYLLFMDVLWVVVLRFLGVLKH